MSDVFAFLVFASMIFLSLGLIRPSIVRLESRKKVLTYGVIGFLVSMVLLASAAPSSDPAKTDQSPAPETPKIEESKPVEKPITISSSALYTAYHDNEVAADMQYKGKLVEISGVIDGIDNGTFDNELIVRINAGTMFEYVSCTMLPSEKDNVIALKKDQSIKVSGRVTGSTLGTPFIKECSVIK